MPAMAIAAGLDGALTAPGRASLDLWPVWLVLGAVWTAMLARIVLRGGAFSPAGARFFSTLPYLAALWGAAAATWYAAAATWPAWLAALAVVVALAAIAAIRLAREAWVRPRMRQQPGQAAHGQLLTQYTERMRDADTTDEIAHLCGELLERAIGRRRFALALAGESGWKMAGGNPVPDGFAPSPEALAYLASVEAPVTRDGLDAAPPALRENLLPIFDRLAARAVVPLCHREALLGLAIIGPRIGERGLTSSEQAFLIALRERLGWLLSLSRMRGQAQAQIEVSQDMALSAAVQSSLLPTDAEMTLGRLLLAGMYVPATQCGGDFWWAKPLPDGRALVVVGDVTGHGIASAMVTAAARGCADIAHRFFGDAVDLGSLLALFDSAVRRAGGGRLLMTCFVTVVDAEAGRVQYANAGHSIPYLCRKDGDRVKLEVLAARGNPLGSGSKPVYEQGARGIAPGDVLVWYTDGIVECANLGMSRFGDRRMQRLLRTAAKSGLDIRAIRDGVVREAIAFQEGAESADDMTLIVGQIT